MRFTLLFLSILIAHSCSTEKTSSNTYFGGEVLHPNDSYIVLYKNEKVIDSAKLDANNRFLIKLSDDFEEGLYHFNHRPEEQYIFIEKGDSILIRLNTLYFDESLVFTGKGAEKNNFLIEMFLIHEDEENLIRNYYGLEPDDFNRKMDSLKTMKFEQFNDLTERFELSENAKNVASASINYPYYDTKEIYPYMHKESKSLEKVKEVPTNFYNYRQDLDFNDSRLSYFRPYLDYLVMHFSNLSYVECKTICDEGGLPIESSLHFHTHKLKLIDSIIKKEDLRDNLFRNTAYTYLLQDQNPKMNKEFISAFNKYSKNNKYLGEINDLYTSIKNLHKGNQIPIISLIKTNGDTITSDTVLNDDSVYYFWSMNQKNHMKKINNRVKVLKKKYPSYNFIGININSDQERWLKSISMLGLNVENQYRATNFDEVSRKFIINGLNKVIIVKSDGIIVDAFSYIYDSEFENTLKSL